MGAYTNIPKPTGAVYTKIAKPTGGTSRTIKIGMATGLLIPLTYATSHTISVPMYTRVAKPTGASYTNVLKPIT